jgi:hypothetical protein
VAAWSWLWIAAAVVIIVEDIAAEVERLRAAGLTFRNDIVSGPGGPQILLEDPCAARSSSSSPPVPEDQLSGPVIELRLQTQTLKGVQPCHPC